MPRKHIAQIQRKCNGLLLLFVLILCIPNFHTAAADDSMCARVKIEIHQEVTLERQAFDAHMRINNGFPAMALENVGITVTFADEDGNPVSATDDPDNTDALFFIRLERTENIDHIDGTGTVPPGASADLNWLIIPTAGAAKNIAGGALYYVGAELSYTMGGEDFNILVNPDYIFVKPLPVLTLDYFLPEHIYGDDAFTQEIEPSVPFTLGVRIRNNGHGTAWNLKIKSAEPKIVENDQSLLIGFAIEGSEVNGQPGRSSMLVDFGDIPSGSGGTARWFMSCSVSGTFVEFSADYSHADELGGELTSLIQEVNTHTNLIHDVLVGLPGRDGIRDFLVKTDSGIMVFESDLVDTPVTNQSSLSAIYYEADHEQESWQLLTIPVTDGFMYAKLPAPYQGTKEILEVFREDGKRIPLENIWLSKERDEDKNWRYYINLFDWNTLNSYRVIFTAPASRPHAPALQYIPDQTINEGETLSFLVCASDPDGTVPTLFARPLPKSAHFIDREDGTGIFRWTPDQGQGGVYAITFEATDSRFVTGRRAAIRVEYACLLTNEGVEICDGIDNDCDGFIDEEVMSTFYFDEDGDGYGDPNDSIQSCNKPSVEYVLNGIDCNDSDPNINPLKIRIVTTDEITLTAFEDGINLLDIIEPSCSPYTSYDLVTDYKEVGINLGFQYKDPISKKIYPTYWFFGKISGRKADFFQDPNIVDPFDVKYIISK